MWAPLLPELVKHHTVIVPDLRGAGASARPQGGYDKKNMARDIHELVRGGQRTIEIGCHSPVQAATLANRTALALLRESGERTSGPALRERASDRVSFLLLMAGAFAALAFQALFGWALDVSLPRGISRHVVRFVRLDGTVYAVKETG